MAAKTVVKVSENDVRQWLPKGFEEAEKHDWFTEHFGVDEMIVASWEGCTPEDPRLGQLAEKLRDQKMSDGSFIYDRVMTGTELLTDIQDLGLGLENAKNRMRGVFLGPDSKQTCLLAYPSKSSSKNRSGVVENLLNSVESSIGLTPAQVHIGGPTVDGAMIDIESKKSLQQFIGLTVIAVLGLCWFRLRNIKLSLIVLVFSVYAALLSLAILYWTGGKMNLTMIMLPTLIFILTVSASVHLVNYFHKAAESGPLENAAREAVKGGGFPVALSSLTTAVGMISLASSQITPIRMFGIYAAVGLVVSIPLILIALPATLHFLSTKLNISINGDRTKKEIQSGVSRKNSLFVNWICRSHWWITVPAGVCLVFLAVGTERLKASVKIQDRFASSTKIIQDYLWLEKNLGPLVPMEVIVRFDKSKIKEDLNEWHRMRLVRHIEKGLRDDDRINATMSASMFAPPVSTKKNAIAVARQRTAMAKWEEYIPRLVEGKLIANTDTEQLWRISVRMAAMNDIDYGDFVDIVNSNVDEQLAELKLDGVKAVLTGSIPMMYKAQHQVLDDLMNSFLMAFVLISLVIIFVLRSVAAGLVAMIPNVFPPIVVFGAMGWMNWSIEIGSVMTASVALGIAVDDTIHFLTWYRRGISSGLRRYGAIRYAFEHCSKAMIDTTLICGLGVACFMFSVFMPTVKFARLLLVLLCVALVGDLILLPAILAGPLGKLFRPKQTPRKPDDSDPDSNLLNDDVGDGDKATVPSPASKRVGTGKNLTQSI